MNSFRTLHILAASSRTRAELARIGFQLGYHAEVYADTGEIAAAAPRDGIVIVEDQGDGLIRALFDTIARSGIWLPVVALGENPRASRVVEAMREGVLDYISLPVQVERLTASLRRIAREAEGYARERLRQVQASNRLATLSPREREVLDRLADGMSNKLIARELDISPRTVEIHRANMMNKLAVEHSAAAIRLRIEAELSSAPRQPGMIRGAAERVGSASTVIGYDPIAEMARMPAAT